MSLQKINFDIIDREAQTYKKAKSEFESTSKTLQKTIEVNTKNEVDAVKSAIENLNKTYDNMLAICRSNETVFRRKSAIQ